MKINNPHQTIQHKKYIQQLEQELKELVTQLNIPNNKMAPHEYALFGLNYMNEVMNIIKRTAKTKK